MNAKLISELKSMSRNWPLDTCSLTWPSLLLQAGTCIMGEVTSNRPQNVTSAGYSDSTTACVPFRCTVYHVYYIYIFDKVF